MTRYEVLVTKGLVRSPAPHLPMELRTYHEFRDPQYVITRPDPHTYHIACAQTGKITEVPASNVGWATPIQEPTPQTPKAKKAKAKEIDPNV